MITVLVAPGAAAGRRTRLDEAEQHHLRVRRAAGGERVALRDGEGLVGTGLLVVADRSAVWEVDVEAAERRAPPAALTLAVGAGDRERFGWMVEKAVELGATRIVPLTSAHTAGVASRVREPHLAKLRRRALEATKQCGAAWAPEVEEPVGLAAFVTRDVPGLRWLADAAGEPAGVPPRDAPVTVVIGPEGGLEDAERGLLLAAGYRPVALATQILRFETAALAAAAAVAAGRLGGTHG